MITEEHVRKVATEKCLIATDVDQTILRQSGNKEEEKLAFFGQMAPQLAEAARLGVQVAFITGNSMHELCSRFLDSMIEYLCFAGNISVLNRLHFFANSGAVYFHFPDHFVAHLVERQSGRRGGALQKSVWNAITTSRGPDLSVQSQYVDKHYVERCLIQFTDAKAIEIILLDMVSEYLNELRPNVEKYETQYNLKWVRDEHGQIVVPKVELRSTAYRDSASEKIATVQITLKPILSFHQAHEDHKRSLINSDLRSTIVKRIQDSLDKAGLGHYVARPGGRGSIDVTLERVDKAYALEFLIDRLRLQGNAHRGQHFGSNTIYFGDEVMVGGGNDYAVTRIPGLLVFAVNRDPLLVPILRDVFVPSAIFTGPEATADVLSQFNMCARHLLMQSRENHSIKTAIEALKEEIFSKGIEKTLAHLKSAGISADDWQTLHTFVTLMARDQTSIKQWLSLLVKELNTIMAQLALTPNPSAKIHRDPQHFGNTGHFTERDRENIA